MSRGFELTEYGEHPGYMGFALADVLPERIRNTSGLLPNGHEAVSKITTQEGATIEVSASNIEDVSPLDEPGSFLLRLRTSIGENNGTVIIAASVSGAALLACAAMVHVRTKN
ncbi:MAG: hypothetical protein AAB971_03695 [Patescibacteria group bacterium]